jgi:hypothetical protein
MENQTPENAGNAQPQISQPTVGQSEDFKARAEQLEREKQGILNDLRQEREKRQQLEQAVRTPSPAAPAVANPELDQLLSPYIAPLKQELEAMKAKEDRRNAAKYIAKMEKMDPDDVPNSSVMTELLAVAQEFGIRGSSAEHEARLAYELLQKRRSEKAAQVNNAEAQRANVIQNQMPESSRGVQQPSAGVKRVSAAEVGRMSVEQFQALQADAQKHGYEIQYYKD